MNSDKILAFVWFVIVCGAIGWGNSVIHAIENESIVLGLVSLFAAPFAAIYGLILLFI